MKQATSVSEIVRQTNRKIAETPPALQHSLSQKAPQTKDLLERANLFQVLWRSSRLPESSPRSAGE